MFLILGIGSFVTRNFFTGDASIAFLVFGIVFMATAFVFILTAVFQNMCLMTDMKKEFNQFYYLQRKIGMYEKALEKIKTEFKDYFTKLYPEYEKEIFAKMSPNEAEHLTIYLAKYPELKFNGILESFTNKVYAQMKAIQDTEESIEFVVRKVKDRKESKWLIFNVPVPADIEHYF